MKSLQQFFTVLLCVIAYSNIFAGPYGEKVYLKVNEEKTVYLPSSVINKSPFAVNFSAVSPRYADIKNPTKYSVTIIGKKECLTPVIVRCDYFYTNENGLSGRGFYDFEVVVSKTNVQDPESPVEPGDKKIILSSSAVNMVQYETSEVKVRESYGDKITWRIQNSSIADITPVNDGWTLKIKGKSPGVTYAYASDAGGGRATCKITVTSKKYEDGEYLRDFYTEENIRYGVVVTNAKQMECALCFVDVPSEKGNVQITIPPYVNGLAVVKIGYDGRIDYSQKQSPFTIILPKTVREIGDYAFCECNLESIILTSNLQKIGSAAFANTSIMEIIIPEGVKDIGINCFAGTKSLRYVYWPSTAKVIPEQCFYLSAISDIQIPEGVERIENSAFMLTNIRVFSLPASILNIDGAFWNRNRLAIISRRELPPVIDIQSAYKTLIYVPEASVDIYKQTENWNGGKILPQNCNLRFYFLFNIDEYGNEQKFGRFSDSNQNGQSEYIDTGRDINKVSVHIESFNGKAVEYWGPLSNTHVFEDLENMSGPISAAYKIQKFEKEDCPSFIWPAELIDQEVKYVIDEKQSMLTITLGPEDSGITNPQIDNEEAIFYNLQGTQIKGIPVIPGIYIKKQGSKTTKTFIR